MKRTMKALILLILMVGGAAAQPPSRELGLLAETRNKLKNVATALEMWAVDHQGQYPERLDQLVGSYLRTIPGQLDGGRHWNYRREPGGYSLSDRWSGFSALGVPEEVVYNSDSGLQKIEVSFFPEFQLAGWQQRGYGGGLLEEWKQAKESIVLQLRGPQHLDETPDQARENHRQWILRKQDPAQTNPTADLQPRLKNGWKAMASARQGNQRVWLVSRGETLLQVDLSCDPALAPEHRLEELATLVNRL